MNGEALRLRQPSAADGRGERTLYHLYSLRARRMTVSVPAVTV